MRKSVKYLAIVSSFLAMNTAFAIDLGGSAAIGASNEGATTTVEASYDGINLSDNVTVGGAVEYEKIGGNSTLELYPASITVDYNEYALNAGPAFEITDKSKETGGYISGAVMLNNYDISVDATVATGVLDNGTINLGYDVVKIGAAIDTSIGDNTFVGISAEHSKYNFNNGSSKEQTELEASLNYALTPSSELYARIVHTTSPDPFSGDAGGTRYESGYRLNFNTGL